MKAGTYDTIDAGTKANADGVLQVKQRMEASLIELGVDTLLAEEKAG